LSRSILLAFVVLLFPLPAHAGGSAPAPQRVTGAFAQSDLFWTWDAALLLHVDVTPHGETLGYVRSSGPYLIDCPNACTRPLAFARTVELTAYPSPGATFDGWDAGVCEGQGNPCTFTITEDTIVGANFGGRYAEPQIAPAAGPVERYTLTVTVAPGVRVTSTPAAIDCASWPVTSAPCAATFPAGTVAVLHGTPLSCMWMWQGDGTIADDGSREVVMTANRFVVAAERYRPFC
jgi:hypothetical protein